MYTLMVLLMSLCVYIGAGNAEPIWDYHQGATVNITHSDASSRTITSEMAGRYGLRSKMISEWGVVIHIRTENRETHECTPPLNAPQEPWIALIQRRFCKFTNKIHHPDSSKNASAVVIYNDEDEDELVDHNAVEDVVSIYISKKDGEAIASLVDDNARVMMFVKPGARETKIRYSATPGSPAGILIAAIATGSIIFLVILPMVVHIWRHRKAHSKVPNSDMLLVLDGEEVWVQA